ncbi:MAG: hypothetical protein LBS24_04980 [Clostridiales Family XIII bacterium]|jgi:hypothetical protein|nr:hypothetical protein [Clostridiales Family XIII bacterium]
MKKYYLAAAHNVVRILDIGGIGFPISKSNLLAKVGDVEVRIDFNRKLRMADYCANIKIENFENKSQFFCALNAANASFD